MGPCQQNRNEVKVYNLISWIETDFMKDKNN